MHDDQLREDQNRALAGLDAFVTVSEADAARYRAALPQVSTRILCIPNSVPAPGVAPSTGDSRTIVAAGRLVEIKRYDRLLDAFAKVAPQYPDWSLRIYGRGTQKQFLRKRIDELGLYDQVRLMGAVSPIEPEWAKGAIAAVSSDGESFGMTIVEAMHCGVPVVATDCPHGPGEIISDGRDGVLVPLEEGSDAFAHALASLMQDAGRRGAMADAAREKAARYAPDRICARCRPLRRAARRRRPGAPAGAAAPCRRDGPAPDAPPGAPRHPAVRPLDAPRGSRGHRGRRDPLPGGHRRSAQGAPGAAAQAAQGPGQAHRAAPVVPRRGGHPGAGRAHARRGPLGRLRHPGPGQGPARGRPYRRTGTAALPAAPGP